MDIKVGEQYIQKFFKVYPVTVSKVSKNKVWIKDPQFDLIICVSKDFFEIHFEKFTIGSLFGDTIF